VSADTNETDRAGVVDALHRYCTAIDTKDWALLAASFVPEARADYRGRAFPDAASIVRYMADIHRDLDGSAHRVTNVVIELDGDTARTTSLVDALLVDADHPHGPTLHVVGTYRDVLHRDRDGGGIWRIAERRFVDLWTEGERSMLASERSPT
jgi:hypothetical protein